MRRACVSAREQSNLKPLAALIVAGMAAAGARAEERGASDGSKVDPILGTAPRTPEPLSSTIQPVELITEHQIQKAGQDTATELLQSQANVQVTSTGGF